MILVARYALILTFFLSSCNWQSNTETKVTGEIYGTTYKYIFNHPADKPSNELINQQILEELNRIDLIFSTYKQNSEVLNTSLEEIDNWSQDLKYIYNLSLTISEKSKNAFNPLKENTLDFSAIAKGYAVDRVADLLTENQIDNYFIEIGGEIRAQGRAAHLGNWRWAIEDPFSENPRPYKSFYIPQEGISIATSGEYRNPGHIWGGGPRDILSVSVAANDAARADAWATAMYVLGLDEGIIIAETYDLAVFFILSDGNSIQSTNWGSIFP